MDFPVYLEFGMVKVLLHNIFEPLAFFIGFRYFLYLKKKKGDIIEQENRTWIIIGAIFGALAGSRLVGGFENFEQLKNGDNILLHFYTNKTVLGGLLGGLFGVEITKKIIKEKNASGDLFVYPFILALIIGRIGCFSMGLKEETYGMPTSFFMGIDLGDGKERHPVTLYEITFLVLLWVFFRGLTKRFSLSNGSLFKLFMIAYISFRFTIDFIKPRYIYSAGLSAIQIACLMGLLWYLPYIINPRKFLNK
jgi:phosphatidylglycerol---prolipoprotein diacylglyceryl transferase